LVSNVVSITFQFAVNTTTATSATAYTAVGPNSEGSAETTGNQCPADTWIATKTMSTADWSNVCAIKVDMVLLNPLYQPNNQAQPTPGQQQFVTFERVISLLNNTGVDVTNVTQS
jgi:hypothetical protein